MSKPLSDLHEKLALARALGHKPTEAARIAGYKGGGKTFAANARKACNRPDVKARIVELRAPSAAKVQQQIDISVEWANRSLAAIAGQQLDPEDIKATDVVASFRLLAQINGWLAPEKVEHSLNGLGDRLDRALARAKRKG
jgi:hypothetical protein